MSSTSRNKVTEAIAVWRALPAGYREDYLAWLKARHDRILIGDMGCQESEETAPPAALALLRAAAEPEAKAPKCRRCGGTGEIGDNDDQRCPNCGGSGVVVVSECRKNGQLLGRVDTPCPVCKP